MGSISFYIFLSVFATSIIFTYWSQGILYGQNGLKKKNRDSVIGYLCLMISIIIPCMLAAFRDWTVGTDIGVYIIPNFRGMSSYAEKGFLYYFANMPLPTEIGFAYLLYLGRLFDNIGITFFLIELLTIVPIYMALDKYRKNLSVTLGMAVFLFLNYNFSFSCMRGSIAMSILLYDFYYLQHRDYRKAITIFLVALFFHNSAVLVFAMFWGIIRVLNSRHAKLYGTVLGIGIIIFFLFAPQLLFIMTWVAGLASARYVYYLNTYIGSGSMSDVPLTDFLCKSVLLAIVTYGFIKTNKFNGQMKLLFLLCFLGRVIVLFNSVFYEAMRVAFYFDLFLILYGASYVHCVKRSTFNKWTASIIVLLPCFLYWAYFIMGIGAYETNIYRFR